MKRIILSMLTVFFLAASADAAPRMNSVNQALDAFSRQQRIDTAFARARAERASIERDWVCWEEVCLAENDSAPQEVVTEPVMVQPDRPRNHRSRIEPLETSANSDRSWYREYLDPDNPRNDIEIALEIFDYSYREPGLMKTDGPMLGGKISYTHRTRFNERPASWSEVLDYHGFNMYRLDFTYTAGNNLDYRSNGTGELEGEQHRIWETRAVVGYDYPYKGHLFTPYAGLGYWFLEDHDGRKLTTTGHSSYDRDQEYWYVPVGIDYKKEFSDGWEIMANLEYDYMLNGTNNSYFRGLGFGGGYYYGEDGTHQQNEGHGYRGSIKILKPVGNVDVFFEPFFRIWHIEESDQVTWVNSSGAVLGYTYEPDNRTTEYGARIGVRF
ncbi:MAG: hypothetical protein ACLFPX_07090 [Candidatus Omnitrophota bacterium]